MKATHIFLLVVYSIGMAVGQLLFKLAAKTVANEKNPDNFLSYFNIYFITAVILYLGLTLIWVWLLRFIPLSKAYPFVVLAFVFTPLLATIFIGEALSKNYLVGLVLIVTGLIVVTH